jgi:hypothetical protein
MRPIMMISAAACLLTAGAAFAQAPAQSTPAPSTPAAKPADAPAAAATPASPTVSDAELKRFAALGRSVKTIMDQHQPAIAAAADAAAKAKEESAMSGELQVAVTDAGFTVQRYNEIAQAMQKDASLFARMQQLAAGSQPAASTSQ